MLTSVLCIIGLSGVCTVNGQIKRPQNLQLRSVNMQLDGWTGGSNKSFVSPTSATIAAGTTPGTITGNLANIINDAHDATSIGYVVNSPEFASVIVTLNAQQKVRYLAVHTNGANWGDSTRLLDAKIILRDANKAVVYDSTAKIPVVIFVPGRVDPLTSTVLPSYYIFDLRGNYNTQEIEFGDNELGIAELDAYAAEGAALSSLQALELPGWNGGLFTGILNPATSTVRDPDNLLAQDPELAALLNGQPDLTGGYVAPQSLISKRKLDLSLNTASDIQYMVFSPRSQNWGSIDNLMEIAFSVKNNAGSVVFDSNVDAWSRYYVAGKEGVRPSYLIVSLDKSVQAKSIHLTAPSFDLQEVDAFQAFPDLSQFSRPGIAFFEYPYTSGNTWPALSGSIALNQGVVADFNTDVHIKDSRYMLRYRGRLWITESDDYTFSLTPKGQVRILLDGNELSLSPANDSAEPVRLEHGMHDFIIDFKATSEADVLSVLCTRGDQEPIRLDAKNIFLPNGFEAQNVDSQRLPLKVGIVYSPATEIAYGDAFHMRQVYAACQLQSVVAGIPFDLINANELMDYSSLTNRFGALIIPALDGFTSQDANVIATNLQKLMTEDGVGIVASSELFSYDSNGVFIPGLSTPIMEQVFKISPQFWSDGIIATVSIPAAAESSARHPIHEAYNETGKILDYKKLYFAEFAPVAGASADVLATIEAGSQTYNGVLSGTRGVGRFVHFSNPAILMDTRMTWAALRWVFSKDADGSPFYISPTRSEGIFLARNDMDLSRFFYALSQTEIPLLEFLKDWKKKYSFVGSYYINNGDNPANGEFTDWSVSKPLYDDYIKLGNEIGTHSYTHPQRTADLNAEQLQFEFQQSKIDIEAGLGNTVYGTAIPGEDETLFVVDELKKYLDYVSGHGFYSESDRYQNPSIGYLTPQDDLLYFSLNTTPDYVLGSVMLLAPEQSIQFWKDEIATAARGMPKGIIQFLWHDYAVTTAVASGNYSPAMIEETVKEAYMKGYEFVTLEDFMFRYRAARNNTVNYSWVDSDTLAVRVTGGGLGQYAMEFSDNLIIGSVKNWHAYNNNTIFVPENGGFFEVDFSSSPQVLTRITSLPMRMKLISTNGDGTNLDFAVQGEGQVEISLNAVNGEKYQLQGMRNYEYLSQDLIRVDLSPIGSHNIQIRRTDNILPIVQDVSIMGDMDAAISFALDVSDFDGTVQSVEVSIPPTHGTLVFTGFKGVYTPNPGFTGVDGFEISVIDDKGARSLAASGAIKINKINSADGLANYNVMNRDFVLDGNFDEWESLESIIIDPVDATEPLDQLDFREISLAHNSDKLFIRYTSEKAAALNWAHNIYLDLDANPGTGYQFWYLGADFLIQAGKAYKYLGTGADWNWQALPDAQIAHDSLVKNFEISINRAVLGSSPYVKLAMLSDNFAYPGGSTFDFVPDGFTTTGETLEYYFVDPNSNFPPSATPDSAVVLKNSSHQFRLNGIDRESAQLSYQITSQPQHGLLDGLPPNISYIPDPGYLGEDSFKFVVSDGTSVSASADVSIRVIELPADNIFSNDGSNVFLDGNLSEWKTLTPLPSDTAQSLEPGAGIDWNTGYLAHDSSSLFVAVESAYPIALNWGFMVFIDTDLNGTTGFQLGAVPGKGFDVMVQGSSIFSYSGTGPDWNWNFVAFTDRGVNDNVIEFRVPTSALGAQTFPKKLELVFYGDNAAFTGGSTVDIYPNADSVVGPVWTYELRDIPSPQNEDDQPVQIVQAINHTLSVYDRAPVAQASADDSTSDPLLFQMEFSADPRSTWNLEKSLDLNDWSIINNWKVYGAESHIYLEPKHFEGIDPAFFLRGIQATSPGSNGL